MQKPSRVTASLPLSTNELGGCCFGAMTPAVRQRQVLPHPPPPRFSHWIEGPDAAPLVRETRRACCKFGLLRHNHENQLKDGRGIGAGSAGEIFRLVFADCGAGTSDHHDLRGSGHTAKWIHGLGLAGSVSTRCCHTLESTLRLCCLCSHVLPG